jgi:hypothetical protein
VIGQYSISHQCCCLLLASSTRTVAPIVDYCNCASRFASAIKEHDKATRTAESDKADAEAYIMALIKKKGIKATISEVVGSTNTDKEVTDVDADNDDSDTSSAPIKYGLPPTRSIKEIITIKVRAAKKERDNQKKKWCSPALLISSLTSRTVVE